FLKPPVSKNAAEACAYELNYRPQPNWNTYRAYLDFGHYLMGELSKIGKHLIPRDMIDVQSFIWVSAGGYE
ncbi:hypothetical protein KAU45_08145, partial [bacterium]|nr:hypothetical protein [bacterium]